MYVVWFDISGGMVWQVGAKGHGAELMIDIEIASMHALLYIDILGPSFVMSGGAMDPLPPPVLPPMFDVSPNKCCPILFSPYTGLVLASPANTLLCSDNYFLCSWVLWGL